LDFSGFTKKLSSFDWRSLKRYASPQASEDLNVFLEKLPQNASQTMLMIAAVAWSAAGASGLFTAVQLQQLTQLRSDLQNAEAVQPRVPQIKDSPIDAKPVKDFADNIKDIYTGLSIKANGASIEITGKETSLFGQFREAIGHVQNGGSGWRVSIESFCVGRECKGQQPLRAVLTVNKVSVN
jgi:hypothetical protein